MIRVSLQPTLVGSHSDGYSISPTYPHRKEWPENLINAKINLYTDLCLSKFGSCIVSQDTCHVGSDDDFNI